MGASAKRERRIKMRKSEQKQTGKMKKAKSANVPVLDSLGETDEAAQKLARKKFTPHDLKSVQAMNPTQELFMDSYFEGTPVILTKGPAGTAKTFLSLYCALLDAFDDGIPEIDKVVIVRSAVETRKQGYLPGPQPYSAKVLTPDGWDEMGNLEPGDYVMAKDGTSSKVLEVFDKGVKDVYKVETLEGKSTRACSDHLWHTRTHEELKRNKKGDVRTTQEIADSLKTTKFIGNGGETREVFNHVLPRSSPMCFTHEHKTMDVSPYILGYMLGDGNFQGTPSICVQSSDYPELIEKIEQELLEYPMENISVETYDMRNQSMKTISFSSTHRKNKRGFLVKIKYQDGEEKLFNTVTEASEFLGEAITTIRSKCSREVIDPNGTFFKYVKPACGDKFTNTLRNILDILGLLDKTGCEKQIPQDLIYSMSVEERLGLLQGLMDSDGCASKSCFVFYNSSKKLIDSVVELVWSLGGRATVCNRGIRENSSCVNGREVSATKDCYEVNIKVPMGMNPFCYTRKASRYMSIKESKDRIVSVEHDGQEEVRCILIDNPEHLYITDDYIVTHNTFDDKNAVYEQPYAQICNELMPEYKNAYEHLKALGYLEFHSTAYLRGTTFHRSVVILDEIENSDYSEISTVLTRLGDFSRFIGCGDMKQNDLQRHREQSGIDQFERVAMNMNEEYSTVVEYTLQDIVRSGVVKEFLIADYYNS